MLEVGGEPEQPRAVLDGGGPEGVGGLLGVAALDAAVADGQRATGTGKRVTTGLGSGRSI